MNNFLLRGLLKNPAVRFALADSTALCNQVIKLHDADPAGAAVLAELLASVSLFQVLLDQEESCCVRLEYPGKAGKLIADVNAAGEVRAMPSAPHLGMLPLDPDQIYGETPARIGVIKSENGRILNAGETAGNLASPASDLAFFLSTSDQVETGINCALQFQPDPTQPLVQAPALMIQALPDCDLEEFESMRKKLEAADFRNLLLQTGATAEDFAAFLLKSLGADTSLANLVTAEQSAPRFACRCSRKKLLDALASIRREELDDILRERGELILHCEFCRQEYRFTEKDLA